MNKSYSPRLQLARGGGVCHSDENVDLLIMVVVAPVSICIFTGCLFKWRVNGGGSTCINLHLHRMFVQVEGHQPIARANLHGK